VTVSEPPVPFGSLLKSNSNGTYFGISLENVNRNNDGFVDFEKMIGLDGIALVNIVSQPEQARLSGKKSLQTRITHNDGTSLFFVNISMNFYLVYREHLDASESAICGLSGQPIRMPRNRECLLLHYFIT